MSKAADRAAQLKARMNQETQQRGAVPPLDDRAAPERAATQLSQPCLQTFELQRIAYDPYVSQEQAESIRYEYGFLLGEFRRPRSIYAELRMIINDQDSARQLATIARKITLALCAAAGLRNFSTGIA